MVNEEQKFGIKVVAVCVFAIIAYMFLFSVYYLKNNSENIAAVNSNDYIVNNSIMINNLSAAVCSQACLDNPTDIRKELLNYYTKGYIHMFYAPYLDSMFCADINKIEHIECCLPYTLRK